MRFYDGLCFITINDSNIDDVIQNLINFGNDNLRLANFALSLELYNCGASNAHQCAESFIKAYLVSRNIETPFTHNISRLLKWLSAEVELPEKLYKAKELSKYYILRSQREKRIVTTEELLHAIKIAKSTRRIIIQLFKKDGKLFGRRSPAKIKRTI